MEQKDDNILGVIQGIFNSPIAQGMIQAQQQAETNRQFNEKFKKYEENRFTLTDEEKEMIGDSFDIVVVHESATAVYEFDEAKQKNKVMVPVTYDENNNETSWGHIPDIWVD